MLSPRHLRFAIWMFAVIGALLFQARLHFAMAIGCLLLIFGLLCTTPADAIRLPRWISELFILLATVAVDYRRPTLPLGIHLGILLVMLIVLRLWGKSPWWAVLYGWFPVY